MDVSGYHDVHVDETVDVDLAKKVYTGQYCQDQGVYTVDDQDACDGHTGVD